jgi:hypothetical protein
MSSGRRRWIFVAAFSAALLAAFVWLASSRVPISSDKLRSRVVATLADRLDAEVELGSLQLRVIPSLHAEGMDLMIRHKGRRDVPPLISVKTVTIDADLLGLWRKHVGRVNLGGLDIQIPPRRHDPSAGARQGDHDRGSSTGPSDQNVERYDTTRQVVIDEVVADQAQLTILPREREKSPKVWYMHELHVQSVGANSKMPFQTLLTNAVPPGQINTTGSFGPWQRDDPGLTPLEGSFTFENADLSVFKGISGILAAHGSYSGELGTIDVKGETDTPDFMVNVSGHTVPLKTKYHATVDGTNGNTTIEEIDATFLKTSLVAKGGVYDVKGVRGRRVTLDVDIQSGRLEDIMRLSVRTPRPPMTGALRLQTKFELPPGDRDVVDKLKLDGAFAIGAGRFTNPAVQQKIEELSRRARGNASRKTSDTGPDAKRRDVTSDFRGRFTLGNGTLALSKLTFDVPGAIVELNGQYSLRLETLDFSGNLFMDAKVSETTTGWKSFVLKIVDPLFRKDGRTIIPIKITGTRANPSFGMDVRRVIRH